MFRVGLETDNRELAEYLADAFHDCARSIEDERDSDDGSMFDMLEEARSIVKGMSEDLYSMVEADADGPVHDLVTSPKGKR